jgi:alkylation response protein AidB-like acyl-CoA dehydrogenase
MSFGLTTEQKLLRESVRKLMDTHATKDYVRAKDKAKAYPYELYDKWVEAGLLGVAFPEKYGGSGGGVIELAICAEEIAYTSADFQMCYAGSVFCGINLLNKGSEEQKAYWLPKIANGERRFSISISEPEAGSDVGAMRTHAELQGNDWVINGQKLWNTGAGAKDNTLSVYLKTDTSAHYRKGMSLFLVDNDAPGLKLNKLDMLGRHCAGTYEVFFTDVKVAADRLVGGLNKGWDCILAGLQVERIVSAAGNCGGAQGVVDMAAAWARERKQFGRPIGSNQAIAHMVADMQTEVAAAKALTWMAATKVASGEDALAEITMAKLFSSETYAKVANMGMQIMGGYGYSMEFDMQRHYRDCRSATIAAGSSQIQRNLIAGLMGLKVQG